MAKAKKQVVNFNGASSAEREMRDRMNGIIRDENGKMTHIHGKPIVKTEEVK